jgi:hypothetical protein
VRRLVRHHEERAIDVARIDAREERAALRERDGVRMRARERLA